MGRPKGSPNRRGNLVGLALASKGYNLAEEAMRLYEESTDPEFRLKVISLLFPYAYSKAPEMNPEEVDVTPLEELSIEELKQLELSATKGLEEVRLKIKERGTP